MGIQKEREAFEKHASKFFTDSKEAFKTNGDQYLYDEVIWMWDCWIERAKAQAVPEWISMEDKYPKAGESVLICINGIRQNIAYFYDCSVSNEYSDHDWFEPVFMGGEAGDECVVKTEDVTHWMLLPQEPAND